MSGRVLATDSPPAAAWAEGEEEEEWGGGSRDPIAALLGATAPDKVLFLVGHLRREFQRWTILRHYFQSVLRSMQQLLLEGLYIREETGVLSVGTFTTHNSEPSTQDPKFTK